MTKPLAMISANTSWAITNYRLNLVRALQQAGFSVCALVPPDEGAAKLTAAGIQVYPIPLHAHGTSPLIELRLLVHYIRLLRQLRPAAFLGFTIKPNIYGSLAARLASVPVVNNITGLGQVFSKPGPLRRVVGAMYRLALLRSARVFFQNRESRDLFLSLRLVTDRQAALLPGSGVDLDHFAPAATRPRHGNFVFLLPSRLIREKGIAEFCAAASLVREKQPRTRFQLLGPIEAASNKSAIPREQLKEWERNSDIEYLGSTDDVRPFFASSDCVVLPSYYPEGTPRALIEAAAMGKPIITANMPGCRDVVDDSKTGFLCEPRSAGDLAQAMLRMLDLKPGDRAAMGRRAREKAERQFNEQTVIDAYLHVLQSSTGE